MGEERAEERRYRFVWSRMMPMLMKQPRSSFLERKWAMMEKGDGSRSLCMLPRYSIGIWKVLHPFYYGNT